VRLTYGSYILLVSEDPLFCYSASIAFKKDSFIVSTAKNEKEAFEKLLQDPAISLVLMELSWPNLPSGELIQKMSRAGICKPVVLMATWFETEQTELCLRRGYAGIIDKKLVEPRNLVRQLEIVLSGYERRIISGAARDAPDG
jgi:DNA-binding NarL/FixJ family response regulator